MGRPQGGLSPTQGHGFTPGTAPNGRLCIVTLCDKVSGVPAATALPSITPWPRCPPQAVVAEVTPRGGENPLQQLSQTTQHLLLPSPSTRDTRSGWGGPTMSGTMVTPAPPAMVPWCHVDPGSRQWGGTRQWEGPGDRWRVTQMDRHQRYILIFAVPGPWHRGRGQSPERGAWEGP